MMNRAFHQHRTLRLVWSSVVLAGCLAPFIPAALCSTETNAMLKTLPMGGSVFAVVADDIDGDSRLDLITTNRSEGTAQVLY